MDDLDTAVAVVEKRHRHLMLVLASPQLAFGLCGMLSRLPIELAQTVIVLADEQEHSDAVRRTGGKRRVWHRPLDPQLVRERVLRRLGRPVIERDPFPSPSKAPPSHAKPASGEPFTAVLVDLPKELDDALARVMPVASRRLARPDTAAGRETLASTPYHVAFISAKAAFATEGILQVTRQRVVIVVPARDVPFTQHTLTRAGWKTPRVLAMPLDELALRSEILRACPELAERLALEDKDPFPSAPPRMETRARLQVLIVDDDVTTQMLVSAASPLSNADLTLATSAMSAFEHLASASIDVLIVSASMRSDGGEPIYRLLWRLDPTLKTRSVLVTSTHTYPHFSALAMAHPDRIIARPLTAQVVGKIVEIYAANEITRVRDFFRNEVR